MLEFLKRHLILLEGTIGVLFLTALILAATVASIQSNQIAINNAVNSVTTITVTTTKTTTGLQPIYNGNRIDVLIERLETRNINLANNLRVDREIRFLLDSVPYVDNEIAWLQTRKPMFQSVAEVSTDEELKGISTQISATIMEMLDILLQTNGSLTPQQYILLDNTLYVLLSSFDARLKYLLDRDLTEAAQVLEQT